MIDNLREGTKLLFKVIIPSLLRFYKTRLVVNHIAQKCFVLTATASVVQVINEWAT